MKQTVMDRVNDFSERMLLHYAAPNKELVVEVMQFDAAGLNQLHYDDISKYILVLGQYLVMMRHNENLKNVEYMLLSKTFDHRLNTAKFSRDDVQGKTEKSRRAWMLINDPELEALHLELLVAEAEKMIIEGMGKSVEGLLNALKKEFSGRFSHTD